MLLYAFCPKTMTPMRFLHLRRTYAIMFSAKGSWSCERRRYSMVSDQPGAGPINMHISITTTVARRIIIATSGGIQRESSWSASLWTDSSLWYCRSSLLCHVENAMWDCHYRLAHRLEHNYKWLRFVLLCTLHMTKEKKWDPSHLWTASSSFLALT